MMELVTRYLNVSSVINFIMVASMLYLLVKYVIPTYFSKKNEDRKKDFEALVRQKKQELTSTVLEVEGVSFKSDNNSELKSEFLKLIENKYPKHVDFYKKLESNAGWQEGFIAKDFLQYFPDLLQFDLQFLDIKKIITQSTFDMIHRGDYQKVLLLAWLEKLFLCLKLDQPLPKNGQSNSLSMELPLWRWSLMKISIEDSKWQSVHFDNQSIFNNHRNEIFAAKNLLNLTKNSKLWWNTLINFVYQVEVFYPLEEFDLNAMKLDLLTKKEKLHILKRYHPDIISWDLVNADCRISYEAILNENFSKIKEKIKD